MTRFALLGPQRPRPTLAGVLDDLNVRGPVALISCGWQERETEDQDLKGHVGRPVVNLRLFGRTEEIFDADPALLAALTERQDRLRELQLLYRRRLSHALRAARELLRGAGDPELLEPERHDAVEAVRRLDAHHLRRVLEIVEGYETRLGEEVLAGHPGLSGHREEIARDLEGTEALLVAGGHVVVLLNRLSLFDLPGLLAGPARSLPVVAWSAGAMVLGSQVVLFHDSPPQGPGNAEVLTPGADLYRGLLPLPHAERRLRLEDPVRVGLLARRFHPLIPVTLDSGSRVDLEDGRLVAAARSRRLTPEGAVVDLGPELRGASHA